MFDSQDMILAVLFLIASYLETNQIVKTAFSWIAAGFAIISAIYSIAAIDKVVW